MKHQILFFCFFLLCFSIFTSAQSSIVAQKLTPKEVLDDLHYLQGILEKHASYQGLNKYNWQEAITEYVKQVNDSGTTKSELGQFLTKLIGQLGDRHASVRGYDLPDSLFLPFVVAPLEDKVLALQFCKAEKQFDLLHTNYPYLSAINNTPIDEMLNNICPEEIHAPKEAYFFRAVKQLRNIQESYAILQKELPLKNTFTCSGAKGDTIIELELLNRKNRQSRWDDAFNYHTPWGEELNEERVAKQQFQLDTQNIAYLRIPDMVAPDEAPVFYQILHTFMADIAKSKALIIDVRGNGGGTRHLIQELAKYLVHPDSLYIVNKARQRSDMALTEEEISSLHNRFLYAFDELDGAEQKAAIQFEATFKSKHILQDQQFSSNYFMVLNGQKLSKDKRTYHYNRPVYILANERSFSAASILVATLKGLPNIQIVGTRTDGSSGNSKRFYLPHSNLRVKVSTMVSFQKDGNLLDGYGTAPDIEIKRNLKQILWQEDYQLKSLKAFINLKS